jgi:hypothetical protein
VASEADPLAALMAPPPLRRNTVAQTATAPAPAPAPAQYTVWNPAAFQLPQQQPQQQPPQGPADNDAQIGEGLSSPRPLGRGEDRCFGVRAGIPFYTYWHAGVTDPHNGAIT